MKSRIQTSFFKACKAHLMPPKAGIDWLVDYPFWSLPNPQRLLREDFGYHLVRFPYPLTAGSAREHLLA